MNLYFKLTILLFVLAFTSCEDVIDVDVQEAPTRLVIEASIDWEKGTIGNNQTIKLSKSTPYFDATTNVSVTNASVKVTNNNSAEEFVFTHQSNGAYTTTQFVPVINDSYTLEVIYEGETFTANETLTPVTDITEITQSIEDGFDDEALEFTVIFTDPVDEENYYLFKTQRRGDLLPELEDGDDEFVNGNEISWWFEKGEDEDTDKIEEYKPGDIVDVSFFGISEAYYNYIRIIIEQSEGAGLFSSTPVPLRGNCINITTPDNYAFGYFRVNQVVKTSYTFQ
ncbi:DUF4249 domain-containing protein [Thalassobellus sediminis]|uniref:DUF4249 domain-containing protein n=1 Tax=Thalassobellus sediminis TaxID=3367753 RepID=UPI003790BC3E